MVNKSLRNIVAISEGVRLLPTSYSASLELRVMALVVSNTIDYILAREVPPLVSLSKHKQC